MPLKVCQKSFNYIEYLSKYRKIKSGVRSIRTQCVYTPCPKKIGKNSNAYISNMDLPISVIFYLHEVEWCGNITAKFQAIWWSR